LGKLVRLVGYLKRNIFDSRPFSRSHKIIEKTLHEIVRKYGHAGTVQGVEQGKCNSAKDSINTGRGSVF